MAKNTLGAIWRPSVKHGGRFFDLVVTNDGEGSCTIRLETGDGPVAGAEITVTAKSLDGSHPRPVSGAIVDSCQDDLTERLKAGEFDAAIR